MPLAIRDFTWEETEDAVFITVPLKGAKPSNVDILSSDQFLKVSCPPYLFECLLCQDVDETRSIAQIGNGAVVFKLFKQEPGIWSKLQADEYTDKEIMKIKREEAIVKTQQKTEEKIKEKAEKKREDSKYALNEMMRLENEERTRIEDIKNAELQKASEDLERWKEEQRKQAQLEKERILAERKAEEMAQRQERKKEEQKNRRWKSQNIFEESAGGVAKREVGTIQISHTPRVFPTAARESQTPQEEEWLKKQADARRIQELEDKDLTDEEKNPMFLRDKGNSFFQAGNFQAAVNAYSHAIRLNPKMHSLYSNRAACHLKMRNFFKCIEDCGKALDLLTPPVPQNATSRCKAMVRRGTALCQLEMYVEGLQDYEAALKLDPSNEQLQTDANKIRHIIQTSSEYT